jgi:hypothetical protein
MDVNVHLQVQPSKTKHISVIPVNQLISTLNPLSINLSNSQTSLILSKLWKDVEPHCARLFVHHLIVFLHKLPWDDYYSWPLSLLALRLSVVSVPVNQKGTSGLWLHQAQKLITTDPSTFPFPAWNDRDRW